MVFGSLNNVSLLNAAYLKIAQYFNNKPVGWSFTAQGIFLGKLRNYVYRQATTFELKSEKTTSVEKSINNIIIPLGPYRNLTTLLASLFALHPEAVVLNHAYQRIRLFDAYDFPSAPSIERVRAFKRVAIKLSSGGMAGCYGGTILKSHVFQNNSPTMQYYRELYGTNILKDNAKILFWKESMRFTNKLLSLDNLWCTYGLDQEFVFILPIRNPIHCALSNIQTGHGYYLTNRTNKGFRETLRRIIKLYDYLFLLRDREEISFFPLWETDWSEKTLENLCKFSGIRYSKEWGGNVMPLIQIRPKQCPDEYAYEYTKLIEEHFLYDHELQERFHSFL